LADVHLRARPLQEVLQIKIKDQRSAKVGDGLRPVAFPTLVARPDAAWSRKQPSSVIFGVKP
jgi:hypothetical protein